MGRIKYKVVFRSIVRQIYKINALKPSINSLINYFLSANLNKRTFGFRFENSFVDIFPLPPFFRFPHTLKRVPLAWWYYDAWSYKHLLEETKYFNNNFKVRETLWLLTLKQQNFYDLQHINIERRKIYLFALWSHKSLLLNA